MSTKTDIVMVTWHRQSLTKLVIEAIVKNTKRGTYNLIVIDNNSPKAMQDMLFDYWDKGVIHEYIQNDDNYGLEKARNQGLELCESRYFVCVDNDCLPEPPVEGRDWLERLTELMDNNPSYGAISARTQVMIGTGNIFDGHEDEDIVEFPHPGGSYRIMRTALVKELGGWRDDVPGRGTEERYICGKINEVGYKTGFAVQINTLHLFGDKKSDRWGYPMTWKPEDTGHSDIWHPVLENGDDPEEIARYMQWK